VSVVRGYADIDNPTYEAHCSIYYMIQPIIHLSPLFAKEIKVEIFIKEFVETNHYNNHESEI
jgi:hypothetical protein